MNLNIRLFIYLLRFRGKIILSNDLDTLPACFLAAAINKKRLVFDSHELFSEVPELVSRPIVKGIWLGLERLLLPKIKNAFTVCDSIAAHYKQKYNVQFDVIRNLARFRYDHEFEKTGKESDLTIILYQGALNLGRGIEMMIESMSSITGAQLWLIGTGDIETNLKQLVKKLKLGKKVRFIGRISLDELWHYTVQADIGISLEENMGLNYQYALPNKLFDYIQGRIPVVVSDLTEMKNVVQKYNIGKILYERTPETLSRLMNDLIENEIEKDYYHTNLELAARELCWEREEQKLLGIFRRERNS
jgi:glycosyltransferase involved in cell wall biosynthesis